MVRKKTIAGIPVEDYYLMYRLITCGFDSILRNRTERGYIPPKKICNIEFEILEQIYDTIKETYPNLFDDTGAFIRNKNKKDKKERKKNTFKKVESKTVLVFN